ncbi:MAG: PIN domain-containing protein [Rhizobacter sp.]|nr:PIN domain-containing protein [Chlorobiales bacterium]
MSNRLVDTNLLLYRVDQRSKYHQSTKVLLNDPNHDLFTTSKNISEFIAVATRNSGKGGLEWTVEEAINSLEELLQELIVLYPSPDTTARFRNLLLKYKPTNNDVHDYEIAAIALENRIVEIATHNATDFKKITEIIVISI